jgi:hypothetical protein
MNTNQYVGSIVVFNKCSPKKLIKLKRLSRILVCGDAAAAVPLRRLTEDNITYSNLV